MADRLHPIHKLGWHVLIKRNMIMVQSKSLDCLRIVMGGKEYTEK
jgi:hypothetical protein